ncbi:hypothetical protein [Cellulomonas biazotea]|uniref:Uncharacterized protein n=1 Tax=Cellulomonas biazotea TaxID=1709 RepID=A0A402DV37_9CELL|nr:hypothetical protein [Cellulomonas biazotea]GCE77936.1 hypothetical protein CBZ_29920 [Cellulomonas biazotea]
MPSIVVAGLVAAPAPLPAPPGSRPSAVVAPEDLAGPGDAHLAGASHALLLGERRHEVLVRRQAAALADRGLAVAWRTLPHGPGAILLLAAQGASAALSPGETVAYVEALADRTWSGAWTPSVANLAEPQPTMSQHLRSVAPGGEGFVVTMSGPAPAVRGVGQRTEPDEPAVERGTLYCADLERVPARAREQLLAASGCSTVVDLPSLRVESSDRLGTTKAVEAVALPGGAGVYLPALTGRCPTCAEPVFVDYCPFCHVRRTSSVEPRGALA